MQVYRVKLITNRLHYQIDSIFAAIKERSTRWIYFTNKVIAAGKEVYFQTIYIPRVAKNMPIGQRVWLTLASDN